MLQWMSALVIGLAAGAPTAPSFTQKPTAVKDGEKVRIAFAVDRETDVAVFIEDAQGKVARHLAAGVLGKTAPAPLTANSLSQSITWDGKDDYGAAAAEGPFTVRVALGLKTTFDAAMFDRPQNVVTMVGLNALATGPGGELYTKGGCKDGGMGVGADIRIYSPDGKYLRTIAPYPAGLDYASVSGFGAFKTGEKAYIPRIYNLSYYSYYPVDVDTPRLSQMAVNAEGVLFFLARGTHVCVLDAQGGVPAGWSFQGHGLAATAGRALGDGGFLALSSDGKRVFISGVWPSGKKAAQPAVLWTDARERGPAQVFCGRADKEGAGDGELNNPQGLCTDGKGHVLVADRGNDRVCVFAEADGKFVAAFPAPAADKVAVDTNSGAVYVLTMDKNDNTLIKFTDWKEHKEVARLALKPGGGGMAPFLAVSSGATPTVWVGSNGYRSYALLRIPDNGSAFGAPVEMSPESDNIIEDVFVDRARNEVYVYRGDNYWRFKDGTDTAERVPIAVHSNSGLQLQVAADGNIYGYAWGNYIQRWDRSGKPVPFKQTGKNTLPIPSSMSYQMRGLFIDQARDEVYIIQPPVNRPTSGSMPHVVRVYDLEGNLKREAVTRLSASACGPRVDPAGNIYVAEAARPGSPDLPEFFKDKVPPVQPDDKGPFVPKATHPYSWGYGSIVKFSPQGGEITWRANDPQHEAHFKPWSGTTPAGAAGPDFFQQVTDDRMRKAASKGVLWTHSGAYPVTGAGRCNCLASYFDVDGFGRSFYPDGARCRVGALDTNGNVIGYFGAYGNRDAVGAGDYIPLAMPLAVAATDRYVYVGDINNHRLVRVKIGYAAEAACEAK